MSGHPHNGHYEDAYDPNGQEYYHDGGGYYDHHQDYANQGGTDSYYDEQCVQSTFLVLNLADTIAEGTTITATTINPVDIREMNTTMANTMTKVLPMVKDTGMCIADC